MKEVESSSNLSRPGLVGADEDAYTERRNPARSKLSQSVNVDTLCEDKTRQANLNEILDTWRLAIALFTSLMASHAGRSVGWCHVDNNWDRS